MTTTLIPDGRRSAICPLKSAIWIQMANVRHLGIHRLQSLTVQMAEFPDGSAANSPSGATDCSYETIYGIPDGGDSLPLRGRGALRALSPSRRGLSSLGGHDEGDGTTLLALDLGTHTGWALHQRDGTIISGSETFKPHRFEGGGMRFLRFKRWLTEIKQAAGDLDAVYFEEVRRHAGVDAAHAYGGFLAHLTAWCEHHRMPYQGVPVGTIKKHAAGQGNANKAAMVAAMRSMGFDPVDDNEADALALLHWALATQRVGI
ncbi:crossover junction endodeoxyribonuclease RuvC [Methylococcus capsulatus]|jgi:Holliday junction resolvasome RuvABC endonuclease subunit|uniref:Crossover junction endodeoxyribonuclease RuvC n=2 Tax=Methylococcus capsulatus TaxID=414 RepID=A0AA35UR63_METCP|nr:crossover junction endodeoxyribonuclease RuvC [Methylococcus capsulatus]